MVSAHFHPKLLAFCSTPHLRGWGDACSPVITAVHPGGQALDYPVFKFETQAYIGYFPF